MINNSKVDSFVDLKRKIYLVSLPIVAIAAFFAVLLEYLSEEKDLVNSITMPTLLVWFIIAIFLLVARRKYFRLIELITLIIGSTLFLLKFFIVVNIEFGTDGLYDLGETFYWLPMYFIFIFFSTRGKRALTISLSFLGLNILFGMIYVVKNFPIHPAASDLLVQFYLSNIVYIVALYYLQRMVEVYMNAEAYEKAANTDFLTELPNRRLMHSFLQKELTKTESYHLSVILFDIDNFKKINDLFGHDVGDSVLVEFSNVVRNTIDQSCEFGRWGGEEFLIIAKSRNIDAAAELAKEIQISVDKHRFAHVGSVTASFGVSAYKEGDVIHSLLKRADEAMYYAKQNGKNQVHVC
ncbi:GGDEF domain-containing protein [Bacillus timonensis]|nr:GGDEF domain-containing protein [Bacillus timonensis]